MSPSHLFIIFLFVTTVATAQDQEASIAGVWKGNSWCQVKNSPCKNEVVVYHIDKVAGADTFNIIANKIVDGKEEEMGIIGCKLDRKNNRLVSTAANGQWTFNFYGNHLNGTLFYKGDLYRIIKLAKQN